VAPGHFNTPDAPPRQTYEFTFNFPPGIKPGCHSVTLAVSHEFSLASNTFHPTDELDVATVTWWYNLLDDNPAPHPLEACITKSISSSDAGADAADGGAP
jgi:hypothetical protein